MRLLRWVTGAGFAVVFASPAMALAQAPPTQAEGLFEEGKRLLQDGKVEPACTALATSEKLDHSLGTLGLLATCHEQQGKLATALREYKEVARIAHATADTREAFAQKRAEELAAKVGRVVIRSTHPDALIDVRLDGERVAFEALGSEIFVDPGRPIAITARGPSGRAFKTDVTLAAGSKSTIDLPDLGGPEPLAAQPKAAAPPPAPRRHTDARVIGGLVAGGAAIAGFALAGAFVAAAASDNDGSNVVASGCTSPASCAYGKSLRQDAQRDAGIATGVLTAAGVSAAASITLLVWGLSSSGDAPKSDLTPQAASASRESARSAAFELGLSPSASPSGWSAALHGRF